MNILINNKGYAIWSIKTKIGKMMNQQEMPIYLEDAIPEFRKAMNLESKTSPYTAMHALLKITSQKINEQNYSAVKKCFEVAATLYDRGNNIVKNAVENVFVYSLSNILQAANTDRPKVLAILPMSLYTLYINQLYQHGC